MGSANNKKLVSVSTDALKDQLNRVYAGRRSQGKLLTDGIPQGLFDYLWDLKEKALMEHNATVEVPGNWLDELEHDAPQRHQ